MLLWVTAIALGGAPRSIEDLNLDELSDLFAEGLDARIDLASRSPEGQRQAPGQVTVLYGEDLRRAGCRDLLDALRLIPMFDFGSDVWNTTTPLVRGIDADSRILLLIDGHAWNELLYGATPLGVRIPVEVIETIQVLRGPGSALYGGNASLAVIHVTTRAAGTTEGVRIEGVGSVLPSGAFGRQTLSVMAGAPLKNGGRLGVAMHGGRGHRSDDPYVDQGGRSIDMAESGTLYPALVSATYRDDRLDVGISAESYRIDRQDGDGRVDRVQRENNYHSVHGRASWVVPLAEGVALRSRVSSKWMAPWHSVVGTRPGSFQRLEEVADRTVAGVDLAVKGVLPVDMLIGAEGGIDRGFRTMNPDFPDVVYGFAAGYAQLVATTPLAVITAGVRYDHHTAYDGALSPRVAVSRAWRVAHVKLGGARAFRAPGIVQSRSDVAPEFTTTWELEAGVRPTAWSYLTVGAYDMSISDALVYFYEYDPLTDEESEGYLNEGKTGRRGVEAELRLLYGPLSLTGGYALAGLGGYDGIPNYAVAGEPDALLGAPAHKAVLRADVDVRDGLVVGGSGVLLGPRWAQGGEGPLELPTSLLLNAQVSYEIPALPGLGVAITAQDLLDQNPPYIQAFNGDHGLLPGSGRELGLRVWWER
jgi:outer membrane receptor for ferrienterochelin and colicins